MGLTLAFCFIYVFSFLCWGWCVWLPGNVLSFHLGPYHSELTASRPICAVKHCRAESVVRWGTTREYSGAPGLFFTFGFSSHP